MRHFCPPNGLSIYLVSFLLVGAAGCGFQGEPEPWLETIEYGCPDTGCGTNAAFVDGWAIGELHEGRPVAALGAMPPYDDSLEQSRQENFAGVRLLHLRKGDHYYRAHVEGHRLVGLDSDGAVALSSHHLRDSTLAVELPTGEPAYAHIVDFKRDLPFWISPDETMEAFRLEWSYSENYDPGVSYEVCPPAMGDDAGEDEEDSYFAVFFQGDRYDGDLKLVTATGDEARGWFNVACFKSVASKMLFNRHAVAGAKEGYEATPDQKQALLKMMTADFCGRGQSFTKTGTRLAWTNSLGWQELGLTGPRAISYEAVWDQDGALCLDDARLGNETAIRKVCDLPRCNEVFRDFPDGWQERGYLLSANP